MNVLVTFGILFWLSMASAFAQGTYSFQNRTAHVDAPVFDAEGVPLFGTYYLAELYGGPAQDSLAPGVVLSPAPYPAPFTYAPFGAQGYFSGGFIGISGVIAGEFAWLQVRVWDSRLGNTYDEVAALSIGGYGASPLFYARSGGEGSPPAPPTELIGLQSFSLVPEPGTWIFLCAALVLLCVKIRCRKQA